MLRRVDKASRVMLPSGKATAGTCMLADPLKIIEAIPSAIKALKGKSRIAKLADLAKIAKDLAEAAEATDDSEIDAMIDEIAEAVRARAEKIRKKIEAS